MFFRKYRKKFIIAINMKTVVKWVLRNVYFVVVLVAFHVLVISSLWRVSIVLHSFACADPKSIWSFPIWYQFILFSTLSINVNFTKDKIPEVQIIGLNFLLYMVIVACWTVASTRTTKHLFASRNQLFRDRLWVFLSMKGMHHSLESCPTSTKITTSLSYVGLEMGFSVV